MEEKKESRGIQKAYKGLDTLKLPKVDEHERGINKEGAVLLAYLKTAALPLSKPKAGAPSARRRQQQLQGDLIKNKRSTA